jgi:hypothetical protein
MRENYVVGATLCDCPQYTLFHNGQNSHYSCRVNAGGHIGQPLHCVTSAIKFLFKIYNLEWFVHSSSRHEMVARLYLICSCGNYVA